MPLVRIDLPQSITPQQRSLIGDSDSLRIDPSYLGIQRSAAAFIIDITLSAGSTAELKKQFYATLVDRLNTQAHVLREDVLIVLTEVAKENWSYGNGEAQYT